MAWCSLLSVVRCCKQCHCNTEGEDIIFALRQRQTLHAVWPWLQCLWRCAPRDLRPASEQCAGHCLLRCGLSTIVGRRCQGKLIVQPSNGVKVDASVVADCWTMTCIFMCKGRASALQFFVHYRLAGLCMHADTSESHVCDAVSPIGHGHASRWKTCSHRMPAGEWHKWHAVYNLRKHTCK